MSSELFTLLGASPDEAQIAQLLAERGAQPASRIAKWIGGPRNTIRGALDRLVALGLVARSVRGNTHFYNVESKGALEKLLAEQAEEFARTQKHKLAAVSSLRDDFGSRTHSHRPRVRVFEGDADMRRLYEDTLTATTGIVAWASFDENQRAMPRYFATYYRRRARRGIHMRSIHPDSQLARSHHANSKSEHRTSVLVPAKLFSCRPEIQIYNDKINIVSWQDRVGVLIESEEIANALRSVFELSFVAARSYSKKQR